MKRSINKTFWALIFAIISFRAGAQSADKTLDIVNWNIEWFGSATNGPGNKNLQEENVKKILRYLDADVYALAEIVDTARLGRVVDSLGEDYDYVVSDYSSLASSPFDADWKTGQKLAFIYKKSVVSNVKTRGFMRSSSLAYYNFASGRLPYILNANVNIEGKKRNINFILLHGKAGSTSADYNRRKAAADEMKDSLDISFNSTPVIILGDYNDDLDQTISNGSGPVSSYDKLIKDSTDADHYVSITLPLSYSGQNSTLNYSDLIDHQVVSNEMAEMYIKGSAAVRKDITSVVSDYITNQNTSDHFPVSSRYFVINGDTSPVIIAPQPAPVPPTVFTGFKVWPNPFNSEIFIRSGSNLTNVELSIYNLVGQQVWNARPANITGQSIFDITVPYFTAGIYFLQIRSREFTTTVQLLKQ